MMTLASPILRWPPRRTSRRADVARSSWANRLVIVALAVIALAAAFGPTLVPDSVTTSSDILHAFASPSRAHWFGTDEQGRDVLSRMLVGARTSVLSSFLVVAGFSAIGVGVAVLATVGGRFVDSVLMRVIDGALALPPIVFALALAAVLGYGLHSSIIALILTGWPLTARLLRGVMRQTMQSDYVEGAWILGVPRWQLITRHVLPNSLDVLIVTWAAEVGYTILALSSLSFIGVGAQPPSPEWGAMVNDAAGFIDREWWATFFPGAAIAVTVTTFALLGDILQVRFNPELRNAPTITRETTA